MFEDLPYNTFVFALQDKYGFYEGAPATEYANTFVDKMFDLSASSADVPESLPAESMVALNVWMAAVHELYNQVAECKKQANFATGHTNEFGGGVLPIDIAAAYIIGDSQQTGNKESGHLIYNLAEQVGELFGQDTTGESEANTKIIKALNAIKSEVTLPNACSNTNTHMKLRTMADKALAYMTIPLVQKLIHAMKSKDYYRVKLYAVSVVPLTAGCNQSTYEYLREKLIDSQYDLLDLHGIMMKLESTYRCLGLTCEDIGSYQNGALEQCKDTRDQETVPLAGYVPVSDVTEQSMIDLDLQQMRILMAMGAMDSAQDLYNYGRNSANSIEGTPGTLLTLQSIATTTRRSSVPTWTIYSQYKKDHTFEHNVISKVLDDSAPYDALSPKQKQVLVSTGISGMVMFIETLRHMTDAVSDCKAGDANRNAYGTTSWDEAAASFIGSMEGQEQGGDPKNGGLFMYDIAKENCLAMNTCSLNDGRKSKLNERIELLLYTGQSQLSSLDCKGLERTSKEVEGGMKTILLQALLRDVAWLANLESARVGSESMEMDEVMVRAYAYALTVTPLINEVDSDAAEIIEKNMGLKHEGDPLLVDGPEVVFGAVARAVSKMSNVECNELGFVANLELCSAQAIARAEKGGANQMRVFGFVANAMVIVTIILLTF